MKVKSYLPVFQGFYDTIFSYDNEEQEIQDYNESNGTDLEYRDFEFNYADYHNRVSQKCVEVIERELQHDFKSLKVEFVELNSPREYNFRNDVIYVDYSMSKKDFKSFKKYLKEHKKEFKKYIKDNHSSCSGFVSFIGVKYKTWMKEYLTKGHERFSTCFGSALEFYLENEEYTSCDLYSNLDGESSYINYSTGETVQ